MATSGSFNTSAYSNRHLVFSWTEKSQNIAANTTTISWELKGGGTQTQWLATRNIKLTIDGVTVYSFAGGSSSYKQLDQGTVVATGEYTFTHKADGTRTFEAYAEAGIYVWAVNCTGSKTFTLDTIPRATTPTVSSSSVFMGSAVTINTPRASSSFTHDLAYSFAGAAYASIATGVGTSYSWTTPDLASKIPNATSGTVTIRCITKSGSTTIGTKTITMTLKVPTSVVPTISSVATVEATSGLAAQFGAFIKSKSKIKATITAAGAKGSTIKSYSTTFNGKTYTGSSWTSGLVTVSGSLSLVTTVTDSRGRTAKKTTTITVLDYSKAIIDLLQVYRVNAEGAADQDGIYIAVRYKYHVTPLNNKNTASMKVEYKRSTGTEWATLLTGTALSADTTALPASPTFSTDYQYDVRLTLSDWFGAAAPYTAQLLSGAVILDIGADGDCLGIGETAQFPGHVGFAWTLKTKHGELPRDSLTIPAGANLDTYTTPGYYVFSSASSATIANLPTGGSGSGSVEVYREGEANQVRQVVTRCSAASREIWERLYYSNTWQAWACIYKGGTGRVLWTGGMYMTAGHTAPLDEPVSKQPTGIILVFSEYVDGAVADQSFHHRVIMKQVVAAHPGKAECIQLSTSNLAFFATKYLYIYDDKVVGHANNNATGTGACGITYTNARFVLRYIIGF
jgi:hypothetical protein